MVSKYLEGPTTVKLEVDSGGLLRAATNDPAGIFGRACRADVPARAKLCNKQKNYEYRPIGCHDP